MTAAASHRAAVFQEPARATYQTSLAKALLEAREPEQAVAALEQAVRAVPAPEARNLEKLLARARLAAQSAAASSGGRVP